MYNPVYLSLSRHNIYYFRFPIPKHLHPQGKSRYIRLSLGTRCPREALRLARTLFTFGDSVIQSPVVCDMEFYEIRTTLTEYFRTLLEKRKNEIHKKGQFKEEQRETVQNSLDLSTYALEHKDYSVYGTDEDISKVIDALSLPIKPDTEDYETLRAEYLKGLQELYRKLLEYNTSFDGFDLSPAESSPVPPVRKSNKKLSDLIDAYVEDKKRFGKWTENSAAAFRAQLDLLSEYLGSDAVVNISSDTANDVKAMLMAIPQRTRIKPEFKAMSLQELREVKGQKVMSPKTLSNYLQTYSAFYDWAVKRKDADENHFKDLVEKAPNEQVREDFKPEQVKTMQDEILHNKCGLINKPYQKWGPLIAMYTGARLNEIAQLEINDIKQIEDIWCFDFNDEGKNKRLKNKASKRIVPIHSHLIGAGFMDYVDEIRKDGKQRVLYDLSYCKKNGYGRNLSRWFNEVFLPKLGMKTDKLVLHSFRHTVTTQLFQAGVDEPIVKTIVGHTLEGVTHRVYAKGYKISQLKEAIEKLDY